MIFIFLCLTDFAQYDNLQVQTCCCKWRYYILFYAEQHSTVRVCVHTPIFIQSSISGCICLEGCKPCCFDRCRAYIFSNQEFPSFPDKCLRVGLQDGIVTPCLALKETTLFSIVAALIYISTNSVEEFPFLHTRSTICYLQTFGDGYSDGCEVIRHCNFDLHFSNNQLHFSNNQCCWPFIGHLWKNICKF